MTYNFNDPKDRMRFYKSNTWRGKNGLRNKALERDNNECQWCKRDGLVTTKEMGRLEVDHIIEVEHGTYQDAINLDNLRTLCRYHHNVRHGRFDGSIYKKNRFAEDERW